MYGYLNNCMTGFGYGGFGMVLAVIWWVIIIALIILLARWLLGDSRHRKIWRPGEKNAIEILEERYAKGEIDKEEFETKKKNLDKQ
ncbi:MAG: SHOCT domain-containing protein [Candidatus Portnoybacteria bacterium]|nr:SHOCT domain-containing protein [Candidatus Portnoybacteria bacterium]MDD4983137.1 SHOCT domain-containing protein [Candidatus Portnoybacteria bacterium]